MRVWITKYALTEGIIESESSEVNGNMVTVPWAGGCNGVNHFHKPDWHENLDLAVLRANTMVLKKIASLESQLSRLRKVKF